MGGASGGASVTEDQLQAIRDAVGVLSQVATEQNLTVVYPGELALQQWLPQPSFRYPESLDILIPEGKLDAFCDAMQVRGYHLLYEDICNKKAVELPNSSALRPTPGNPGATLGKSVTHPFGLLIRFYTNWRHGHLLLADLAGWFDCALTTTVLGNCTIKVPPSWALLLWWASLAAGDAADFSLEKDDLTDLHLIASKLDSTGWQTVLDKAKRYDFEYLTRVNRAPASTMIHSYAQGSAALEAAEKEYGTCNDAYHVLAAMRSYSEYAAAIPGSVVQELQGAGTGAKPRKLWDYSGIYHGDPVAPDTSRGKLGVATSGFTIRDQLTAFLANPKLTYDGLEAQGKLSTIRQQALPHGPWHGCTRPKLRDIFKPVP